jgi:tetratricopeptide (TPR) repeat protein
MPGTPLETLDLADEAVRRFPESPRLWQQRGDLIQLGDGESAHSLEEVLHCYETAVKLNPDFAEAYESIGYYFDAIDEDFPRAEAAFLKATQLGGGGYSWAGLARVLAEQSKPLGEIIKMLDACPFAVTPQVHQIRLKLEDGYWHPEMRGLHHSSV